MKVDELVNICKIKQWYHIEEDYGIFNIYFEEGVDEIDDDLHVISTGINVSEEGQRLILREAIEYAATHNESIYFQNAGTQYFKIDVDILETP